MIWADRNLEHQTRIPNLSNIFQTSNFQSDLYTYFNLFSIIFTLFNNFYLSFLIFLREPRINLLIQFSLTLNIGGHRLRFIFRREHMWRNQIKDEFKRPLQLLCIDLSSSRVPNFHIPSTLNNYYLLWQTKLIVYASWFNVIMV